MITKRFRARAGGIVANIRLFMRARHRAFCHRLELQNKIHKHLPQPAAIRSCRDGSLGVEPFARSK